MDHMHAVAESLIRAIRLKPPGWTWQFFPSRPDRPHEGRIGIELFVDHAALRRAGLLAMRQQPERLGGLPVSDVTDLLKGTLQNGFWRFMNRLLPRLGTIEKLSELVDPTDLAVVAADLESALSATAGPKLWLVPGWRLQIDAPLDRGGWIIARGGGSQTHSLDAVMGSRGLDGALFPPINLGITRHPVDERDSWLGVRAHSEHEAVPRLGALFGAISLAIDFPRSRRFSGEDFPEGLLSIDGNDRPIFRTRGPRFPPIMEGASLSEGQVGWIGRLLHDPSRSRELQLRILTCLEYVAAGWHPGGRLGFVHNAIAFDALFGEKHQVTKSIVEGVTKSAPDIPQIQLRIQSLLSMRHALLHGRVAAVELTSEYLDYWDRYDVDPHRDQVAILRTCIMGLNQ